MHQPSFRDQILLDAVSGYLTQTRRSPDETKPEKVRQQSVALTARASRFRLARLDTKDHILATSQTLCEIQREAEEIVQVVLELRGRDRFKPSFPLCQFDV